MLFRFVFGINPSKRHRIALTAESIDERAKLQPTLIKKTDPLRFDKNIVRIPFVEIIGREKLAEYGRNVQRTQHTGSKQRQPVLLEFAPHELPLRGNKVLLFGGCLCFSSLSRHALFVPDTRINQNQKNVGEKSPYHRQKGQKHNGASGQVHILSY